MLWIVAAYPTALTPYFQSLSHYKDVIGEMITEQ